MANYQVTVELDTPDPEKPNDTGVMVVATIDAPDQQTANNWRREIDNFIGKLTGGLVEISGSPVVVAARNGGA